MSISLNKKDIIGLIGNSGSGKTTFVNLITGLLNPVSGEIKLNGINIKDFNKNEYFKNISYVPQNVSLLNDSIKNNILFGSSDECDEDYLKKVIDISGLNYVINKLPNKINFIIGESGLKISGGERQRIGIARALYRKPKVLIMDEALNALNIEKGFEILSKIIDQNLIDIKILITHNHEYLQKCNKILNLKDGKLN